MNCHLNAENAAFTKLRYLDNRVSQVEAKVDNVEQQVLENADALNEHITQVSEKVETEELSATSVTADNATFTNTEAGNLNVNEMTATTVDAETINVTNLENVNVLHGKTVDVDKTIATIGQFTETHTTTANNETTNATELNVSTEANLTGQVNIDGNLTFTKDNGLSKLQGEYLEVDAANVVIENKDKGYALYVPGIKGKALFGGSVSVQDTLTAKNLVVVGDFLAEELKLGAKTELSNPTFKDIKGTTELTTTALVIDREGKLVSKKISSETEGSVASSLVVQKEVRTHTLLDEWKLDEENSVTKLPVSSTAQFVVQEDEILLTNENGNHKLLSELDISSEEEILYSVVHKNFVYILHSTSDDKWSVIPVNTETMEVSPSFDITPYLGEVSSGDIDDILFEKVTFQPAMYGMVLPEDVPTICFLGTNNYLDLSTMEVKTRDTAFSNNCCTLSKNGNWVEFSNVCCTNGKYLSVEDAALGTPACEGVVDTATAEVSAQLLYVDAPVFTKRTDDVLVYLDGGVFKEVAFTNIPGYSTIYANNVFGTVDKDGNPIAFLPNIIIISGEPFSSNVFLFGGYYPKEYFSSTTVSYVDTIVIDKNKVEVNGSIFVDGVWYDKVVNSANALIDFITKKKDKKRYKVLFTGNHVELDTSDTSQVPPSGYTVNDIYGTFDIFHLNDTYVHYLKLNGTPGTSTRMTKLLDACHWHGFDAEVDILFCSYAANTWVAKYLHLNDCNLRFITNGNAVPQSKFYLGISDSNNVVCRTVNIPTALFTTSGDKAVDVTLSGCYNIIFNGKVDSSSTADSYYYFYSLVKFDKCDRCEVNVNCATSSVTAEQSGPGYNFVWDDGKGAGNKFILPVVSEARI